MNIQCDVLIVGAGLAGINAALALDKRLNIVLLSNATLDKCNTYLAQGGITTVLDEKDKPAFIEDTLTAGGHKNNYKTVELVANEAERNINKLIEFGVPFNRDEDGNLLYTKEAAHSTKRILFCNDASGKEIWRTLAKHVKKRKNVTIIEKASLVDIKTKDNTVYGGVAKTNDYIIDITSKATVLACGGIGGIFKNSTNFRNITGIGISLALRHEIKVKDLKYIQIHPTAFYSDDKERKFLLSESLRGEGAKLFDIKGKRFVDELLPRDVVSKEITKRKERTESDYVYLDARHFNEEYLKNRFPSIYQHCLKHGIDMKNELIPVSPSQHYFMGGLKVDFDGTTSMNNLFACGEVSCTGLHGRNRLASNSLLEAVVFSTRVAEKLNKIIEDIKYKEIDFDYDEIEKIELENREVLINKISDLRGDLKNELLNNR